MSYQQPTVVQSTEKHQVWFDFENQKLSYSRCREIFKETLQRLSGYDSSVYGLHSLRAGGVTSTVNNETETTISGRLLKLHGRWKTDIVKDMYVKESEHNRLSVSRTLGL